MDLRRSLPIACAICIFVVASMAPPAGATFPGRNGSVIIEEFLSNGRHLPGSSLLSVYGSRSGLTRRIHRCAGLPSARICAITAAHASPDGSRVLASVTEHIPTSEFNAERAGTYLALVGLRSTRFQRIPASDGFDSAVWTPDGRGVIAHREGEGLHQIDLAGRVVRRLPGGAGVADSSRSGLLAFSRNGEILAGRIGLAPVRLGRGGDGGLSLAPDGRRLAFASAGRLFVMRSDGGGLRRLVRGWGYTPVWSPDGRRIAFAGENRAMYTVRPSGRGLRQMRVPDCYFECPGTYLLAWARLARR